MARRPFTKSIASHLLNHSIESPGEAGPGIDSRYWKVAMKLKAFARQSSAWALIMVLTITLALPGVAVGGNNGKKNFRQGLKYEDAEQWDLAAQEFALAVAAEPANPEYRLHYFRALQGAAVMLIK